jgi:hypothetical protein
MYWAAFPLKAIQIGFLDDLSVSTHTANGLGNSRALTDKPT